MLATPQALLPLVGGDPRQRIERGARAHASGHHAEQLVAQRYVEAGSDLREMCWRGPAGEIDLIVQEGDTMVFVEVKQAARHDLAAYRLDRRQMQRICLSAAAYCENLPDGGLTAMRFDAALVDTAGRVEIIPNAFGWN